MLLVIHGGYNMPYPALELITRAFYLSKVVSRSLQTVTGAQATEGLALLNELLDFKGSDLRLIPYFTYDTFNTVAGQETYSIPNLLSVDNMTFDYQSVRYPMRQLSREKYFGTARVNNITGFPFTYRVERQLDGADIYIYFLPQQVFTMNLWGKFGLTSVALNTDLLTVYDEYYIAYLRYALANYICDEYGLEFPAQAKERLEVMIKKLTDVSPPDMSCLYYNYFDDTPAIDYQIANLSYGWLPY